MSLLDNLLSGRDGAGWDRPEARPARVRQLVDGVVSAALATAGDPGKLADRAGRVAEATGAWIDRREPAEGEAEEELREVARLLERIHFQLLRGVVLGKEADGDFLREACDELERLTNSAGEEPNSAGEGPGSAGEEPGLAGEGPGSAGEEPDPPGETSDPGRETK